MKRIYISIPVNLVDKQDQCNHAFIVATNLAQQGYETVTPFDLANLNSEEHAAILGKCITALLDCDAIYLCKGWRKSKQCMAEFQVALAYEKDVVTE